MDAALAALVRANKITRDLAEARSTNPIELRRLLGSGGAGLEMPRDETPAPPEPSAAPPPPSDAPPPSAPPPGNGVPAGV
jgi:hypothetical protein